MQMATPKELLPHTLGWLGIVRLGLVQTALGGIVVLTTSTLNRVMVVELTLPAALPGLLVALHFAVQVLRPRFGHGADQGGRSTPWIVGGMATLAIGGILGAVATAWMATNVAAGVALATLAFLMVGVGVGAAGTNLLVLLAKRTAPERRAAAATIVWIMMIVGFIITAGTAGSLLDPFSMSRLMLVSSGVSVIAFTVAVLAIWGVERSVTTVAAPAPTAGVVKPSFFEALREVWADRTARHFTIFVFVSMLAYSMQDLILEPYAGEVFGFTPGASTKLAGTQHGGVLVGMLLVAISSSLLPAAWRLPLKSWITVGCLASGASLLAIATAGTVRWPISFSGLVFLLGLCNGAFAIAAIGSMMALAGSGPPKREGVRMGLWGAAQAIAFGSGGLTGAVAVDLARYVAPTAATAYAGVFTLEALLFIGAAILALGIGQNSRLSSRDAGPRVADVGEHMLPAGER